MTSEEIRRTPAVDLSATAWMREMCLQLATLNEHMTRKPGRPPMEKK
jgi:hypothetical protein